jgi:hypothetical protein
MTTVNKLRAAKAELRIREREYNAAARNLKRVLVTVATLEKKRELELSRNLPKTAQLKGT